MAPGDSVKQHQGPGSVAFLRVPPLAGYKPWIKARKGRRTVAWDEPWDGPLDRLGPWLAAAAAAYPGYSFEIVFRPARRH